MDGPAADSSAAAAADAASSVPSDDGVEVVVTDPEGENEVMVTVPFRATLLNVKAALAKKVKRKELMTEGKFLMMLPNGELREVGEQQKLGPRRKFLLGGCPLTEPPPELPPATIEDFDPYSTTQLIESPRTLMACDTEGIDPEELFYAPIDEFRVKGIPKRIMQLRHDFFEAYRLDTVNLVKAERHLLMGEDKLRQIHGLDVVGQRPLEPQHYPTTHAFFADVRGTFDQQTLMDRPKEVPGHKLMLKAPKRWEMSGSQPCPVLESGGGKPRDIISHVTSKGAATDITAVEDASELVTQKIAGLKQLHAGKHELVAGMPLQSEALVGQQMYNHSQKLKKSHKEAVVLKKQQASIAEAQQEKVDSRLDDVLYLRELRDKKFNVQMKEVEPGKFQLSEEPWSNKIQEINAAKACQRDQNWWDRRDVVHIDQLERETIRREQMNKIVAAEVTRLRKVQNMKYLAQIHYTRNWAERRARFGVNRDAVVAADEEYRSVAAHRQVHHEARVQGQKERVQALVDYKREYKALRKMATELSIEREEKRQAWLRKQQQAGQKKLQEESKETSTATRTLTSTSSAPTFKSHNGTTSQISRQELPYGRSADRLENSQFPSPQKQKRYPRFNFGRHGAETVSGGAFGSHDGSSRPGGGAGGVRKQETSAMDWSPEASLNGSLGSVSLPALPA